VGRCLSGEHLSTGPKQLKRYKHHLKPLLWFPSNLCQLLASTVSRLLLKEWTGAIVSENKVSEASLTFRCPVQQVSTAQDIIDLSLDSPEEGQRNQPPACLKCPLVTVPSTSRLGTLLGAASSRFRQLLFVRRRDPHGCASTVGGLRSIHVLSPPCAPAGCGTSRQQWQGAQLGADRPWRLWGELEGIEDPLKWRAVRHRSQPRGSRAGSLADGGSSAGAPPDKGPAAPADCEPSAASMHNGCLSRWPETQSLEPRNTA
jgi:hypothetical protein